jgi:allophanate hydrolase subunit 1
VSERSVAMRFRDVGRHALLVEVDDLEAATAVHRWILGHEEGEVEHPRDVIPAARSVLLDGVDPAWWRELLHGQQISRGEPPVGDDIVVPMRYDGADLADVAMAWDCSIDEVVARHSTTMFVVAFCGFAPGFAYCSPLASLPPVARRPEPRRRVPAGSVGLAGEFCGLYPNEMPGGWQLIGRTDERLFDPERPKPALLQPGDKVRFEVVT